MTTSDWQPHVPWLAQGLFSNYMQQRLCDRRDRTEIKNNWISQKIFACGAILFIYDLAYICTSLCICLFRPCRNKNLTWFNVYIDLIKKYFEVWWYKRYMDLLSAVIQCFIFLCLSGKSTRTYMVSLDYSPLRICFWIWKISKKNSGRLYVFVW